MRRFMLLAAAGLLLSNAPTAWAQVYGDNSGLVTYWYQRFLGRAPDAGMAGWVTALNQGQPPDQVLSGILGSPEFYTRAGTTPQGFISLLFTTVLQRSPTPAELNYWVGRMYTEDRQAVADEVLRQNPGVWITSSAPPPGVERDRHWEWERDRHRDWDRRHDVYDYRRPWVHDRRDEHR
jgi:hypothetical protein